jgi:hypothetical protein
LHRFAVIARQILIGLLALAALVWIADYLLLRYHKAYPNSGDAFGIVEMQRLYAIPQKNGKIDYEFDAQQPVVETPCVHSLFPHMGNNPCWYL